MKAFNFTKKELHRKYFIRALLRFSVLLFSFYKIQEDLILKNVSAAASKFSYNSVRFVMRYDTYLFNAPMFFHPLNLELIFSLLNKSCPTELFIDFFKSTLYNRFLNSKQNFQKNKVVTGKTPFFVIGPFCTHHSICLNIGF